MFTVVDTPNGPLRFDLGAPIDLSWPLHFENQNASAGADAPARNPDAFGLPRPQAEPIRFGDVVLETEHGGSVNCHTLSVCPHGAGTHTECAAHIGLSDGAAIDVVPLSPVLAEVIDVAAQALGEIDDAHAGTTAASDVVIGAAAVQAALAARDVVTPVVVLRAGALTFGARDVPPSFSGAGAAYLTREAVAVLTGAGCTHLVTDLPSIDREDDGGTTPSHKAFFGAAPQGTVTEMARVPVQVSCGVYLMQFHLPPFVWESAPSRPVLFPLMAA